MMILSRAFLPARGCFSDVSLDFLEIDVSMLIDVSINDVFKIDVSILMFLYW